MLTTLFWISLRFAFAALPLGLAIVAARRAFASSGPNAALYMVFAGFAALAGASVMPWAMHLEPATPISLLLSLVSGLAWLVLNRALRRPILGYRGSVRAPVVFRHRAPRRVTADRGAKPGLKPPDWPDLPFLPTGQGTGLH